MGKVKKVPRTHRWTWTINADSWEHLMDLADRMWNSFLWDSNGQIRYCIWEAEVGELGNHHLQGYTEFKSALKPGRHGKYSSGKRKGQECREGVKGLFRCNWMHLEPSKGTQKSNQEYCRKDVQDEENWDETTETFDDFGEREELLKQIRGEFGEAARNGASYDLIDSLRDNTMTLSNIASQFPQQFLKQHTGIQKAKFLLESGERNEIDITYLWGESGGGKSALAQLLYPGERRFVLEYAEGSGVTWWDSYDDEPVVILEEYKSNMKLGKLLKLLDRGVYKAQIKGAHVKVKATKFIITSNLPPWRLYPKTADEEIKALYRRFHEFGEVRRCTKDLASCYEDCEGLVEFEGMPDSFKEAVKNQYWRKQLCLRNLEVTQPKDLPRSEWSEYNYLAMRAPTGNMGNYGSN